MINAAWRQMKRPALIRERAKTSKMCIAVEVRRLEEECTFALEPVVVQALRRAVHRERRSIE
jgi:hypothetical protein